MKLMKVSHFGLMLSNKGSEKIELKRGELVLVIKESRYDHAYFLSCRGAGWGDLRDCDAIN